MVHAGLTVGVLALAGASLASPMPASKLLTTRADTSGCGKSHASGYHDGNAAHSIQSSGGTRYYGIRVPDSYNDNTNQQRKLIFDYHGNSGSSQAQYQNSKYDSYDAGKEYLVVYPQGKDGHWEGPSYADEGVDDIQFTSDLLDHLRQEYCIDSDHVYASGKSNGGGFVDTLACSDVGDQFAAFAMASAALYTDNSEDSCSKKRAIMESHGDQDSIINYHGGSGSGGDIPDIPTWVSWWAQRDGCDPNADKQVQNFDGYDLTTYSCNGLTNVVNHFQIYNLGHCWPSSTGDNSDGSRSYCSDHSLDYTPKVLDFFGQWDLGNAPQN